MRVLVIGGTGLLGRYLARDLATGGHEVVLRSRSSRPSLDVTRTAELLGPIEAVEADAVAYLAALTDLDRCEAEPDLAWSVHVGGARATAEWCEAHGRPLLYVSTDSVFDGARGNYAEHDEVNPLNVYANTKSLGERETLTRGATVVRTNFLGAGAGSLLDWLVGRLSAGSTVTGYDDVRFTPLAARDLATVLRRLLERPSSGLLHVGGESVATKYEVACAVRDALGAGRVVAGPLPQDRVRRPLDTTLDSTRARSTVGIEDHGWRAAVTEVAAETRKEPV